MFDELCAGPISLREPGLQIVRYITQAPAFVTFCDSAKEAVALLQWWRVRVSRAHDETRNQSLRQNQSGFLNMNTLGTIKVLLVPVAFESRVNMVFYYIKFLKRIIQGIVTA